ncbi:hypothetical protein CQW23_14202 [Capsicum baccatum]|uniref:Pentatricopeptide repeat-containing protein n=1 Tax=Capsicum baccatum TaxID=33114 RepID=A0A2G2WII0_CAPBA|nr:hypothetical protein CQW23_14202 [Capsicum baccatum]
MPNAQNLKATRRGKPNSHLTSGFLLGHQTSMVPRTSIHLAGFAAATESGALAETKHYKDVISLCNRMVGVNCATDFIKLNILVNSFCSLKQVGFGFGVLGGMLMRGYSPNVVTISALIKGFFVENEVDEAVRLFKKMVGMGYRPRVKMWGTLINGLCGSGNAERAFVLHKEMLKGNVLFRPNLVLYSMIIDGLCKEGKIEEASRLLDLMVQRGEKTDSVTYNTLMDGFCFEREVDNAKQLFVMAAKGEEWDVIRGKLEDATKLFESLSLKGLVPTDVTYSIMIHCFWKHGHLEKANNLFMDMEKKGYFPDVVTFKKLMQGFCVTMMRHRSFLRTGETNISKRALVAWEKVCLPRSVGGLNVQHLVTWNGAAIIKHLRAIAEEKNCLWIKWIHTYYMKNACLETEPTPGNTT